MRRARCSRETRCRDFTLRSTINNTNVRNKRPRKATKNELRIEQVTGKAAAALPEDPKDHKRAIKNRSKLLQGHDAAKRQAEYQHVCKVELRQAESLQQSAARDLQRGNEEGAKERKHRHGDARTGDGSEEEELRTGQI